jgi:hypothetical protein
MKSGSSSLTEHATREGYFNRLSLLKRFDIRDRLRDIQCPVLFLAAENDRLVPAVEQARYMVERVAGGDARSRGARSPLPHRARYGPRVDSRQMATGPIFAVEVPRRFVCQHLAKTPRSLLLVARREIQSAFAL